MTRRLPAAPAALLTAALIVSGLAAAPVTAAPAAAPAAAPSAARADNDPQVLAISVDALNPNALRTLGRDGAPHLWRLVDGGASTLNARTQVEMTVTLPNHTSMVTGRRIDARRGGHGVTWNDDGPGHPATVQAAAGHGVSSVFNVAHSAGVSTALFASKSKFSLFERSWPRGLDRVMIKEEQDGALARAARRDLIAKDRGFTFLHLGGPDKAGHAYGFMGRKYLAAVKRVDAQVGLILQAAERRDELADLTIILTADHGGPKHEANHSNARALANYRVPFTVWGPGIDPVDLYRVNPAYRAPGKRRVGFAGKQPVRNGNVANLALDLLDLTPVPGSLWGKRHPLRLS